jgi:hypothetical protein
MIGIMHAEQLETLLLELRWTQQAPDVVDMNTCGCHSRISPFGERNLET